jgi:hypothetical protein
VASGASASARSRSSRSSRHSAARTRSTATPATQLTSEPDARQGCRSGHHPKAGTGVGSSPRTSRRQRHSRPQLASAGDGKFYDLRHTA